RASSSYEHAPCARKTADDSRRGLLRQSDPPGPGAAGGRGGGTGHARTPGRLRAGPHDRRRRRRNRTPYLRLRPPLPQSGPRPLVATTVRPRRVPPPRHPPPDETNDLAPRLRSGDPGRRVDAWTEGDHDVEVAHVP